MFVRSAQAVPQASQVPYAIHSLCGAKMHHRLHIYRKIVPAVQLGWLTPAFQSENWYNYRLSICRDMAPTRQLALYKQA